MTKKISAMTELSAVTGAEYAEVADSGTSKKWAPGTLANQNIPLATDLTTDLSYSGEIETVTVGEAVTFNDVLYWDISEQKWKIADSSSEVTMPGTRMALADADADASCIVMKNGLVRDDSWSFTIDDTKKDLYLSTAGTLSETPVSTENYWSQTPAEIYAINIVMFTGDRSRAQYTA